LERKVENRKKWLDDLCGDELNTSIMKKIVAFLMICSCLLGCGTFNKIPHASPSLSKNDELNWQRLTGKWYGNMESKEQGKNEWLVERNLDGTYIIQFKNTEKDGNIIRATEYGEWGISGNIYFTIFKGRIENGIKYPVDNSDPYNRDAYKILKINDNYFGYKNVRINYRFSVKKVSADFILN